MILYIESSKESTKKLFNESSKIEGYKINIKKSIVFPYTENKQPKKWN